MPQLHTQTGCSEAPVTPQGLEPVKSERASPGEKETWHENQPSNEQRESQVISSPCQGTTRPPPGNLTFSPKMQKMQANSPRGPLQPRHSPGAGRLAQLASSRGRSFQGQRTQSVLQRHLSLGTGSQGPPCPACNSSAAPQPSGSSQSIWAFPLNAFLPRGGIS